MGTIWVRPVHDWALGRACHAAGMKETPGDAGVSEDGHGWFRTSDLSRVKPASPAELRALSANTITALAHSADRARRGGSGALSLAIRSSEAESPFEGRGLGVSSPRVALMARVPRGAGS